MINYIDQEMFSCTPTFSKPNTRTKNIDFSKENTKEFIHQSEYDSSKKKNEIEDYQSEDKLNNDILQQYKSHIEGLRKKKSQISKQEIEKKESFLSEVNNTGSEVKSEINFIENDLSSTDHFENKCKTRLSLKMPHLNVILNKGKKCELNLKNDCLSQENSRSNILMQKNNLSDLFSEQETEKNNKMEKIQNPFKIVEFSNKISDYEKEFKISKVIVGGRTFLSQTSQTDSEYVANKINSFPLKPLANSSCHLDLFTKFNKSTQGKNYIESHKWFKIFQKVYKSSGLNLKTTKKHFISKIIISNSSNLFLIKNFKLSTAELELSLKDLKKLILSELIKLQEISENKLDEYIKHYHFVGLNQNFKLKNISSKYILWMHNSSNQLPEDNKTIYTNRTTKYHLKEKTIKHKNRKEIKLYQELNQDKRQTIYLKNMKNGFLTNFKNHKKANMFKNFEKIYVSKHNQSDFKDLTRRISQTKGVNYQMRSVKLFPTQKIFWKAFFKYFGEIKESATANNLTFTEDCSSNNVLLNEMKKRYSTNSSSNKHHDELNQSSHIEIKRSVDSRMGKVFFYTTENGEVAKFMKMIQTCYTMGKKVANYSEMDLTAFSSFLLLTSKLEEDLPFDAEQKVGLFLSEKNEDLILGEFSNFMLDFKVKTLSKKVFLEKEVPVTMAIDKNSKQLIFYKKILFFNKKVLSLNFSDLITIHRSKRDLFFIYQ
jgi:hypothetical protein